ncbi:hypothetical protein K0M31_008593 [Melipona bicolor]|uniref:ELKS/Rab6-interacting/CAST family member 1 n=1 Tax=Melipona bicolor TaxID=60889 RepID=A0AA40KJV6_9HYME|nr:hypothetical protein K0M31_008593 [Melipona bicolor]
MVAVDLHEANKKLQAGATKAGIDTTQERRQLEEQKRQIEEQRRQTEERAKSVDQKARTIEEKERTLQSLDQDLKKRKAKMDQLEQQLQRSGGSPDKRLAEMQKTLENAEKELEKAKEESTRSSAETERLLHLIQMTQEEQNAKERQIRELQDALKAAQAKLKQAATAQQQEPETSSGTALENASERHESRKIELETKDRWISELEQTACSKRMKDAKNLSLEDNESWKRELELKNRKIAELEDQLVACKDGAKNGGNEHAQSTKLTMDELKKEKESWKKEIGVKNERISQLENEIGSLTSSMRESKRCKGNDRQDNDEIWKLEIERKNQRIVELEQEIESLENFLRDHADTESVRDMEIVIERKTRRIEELEDTVAEFEDFLKQNPDVKELHDLRCQVTAGNRRIQELERWIQKNGESKESRIDRERVIELEEMVTQLEDYVRKHNVDVLKRKLQDRECRIDQLQSRVGYLEKELLRVEENHRGKETQKDHEEKETKSDDLPRAQMIVGHLEVHEMEQKIKKMEVAMSEKDNKIQEYEQQIVENKEETTKLKKETAALRKELNEYDDIGVLKEEIRVRDERIQQLEDEIDSLERAFSERIDLEQIEELVNVIKEKEEKERQFSQDLIEKRSKIEELSEALRESVVITSDSERRLKNEEKLKKETLQKVAKLEQRIASMQTASALKCITCQPLLSKLQKYEKKLQRLTEERNAQLEDLRQMKREALKAAVSEKDAHLALLELSGIKTVAQSEQADRLTADRKRLLETLKKEDEKSIELSVESSPTCSEGTPQLLTKVLDTSDDDDDDDDEETPNDRRSDSNSPRPATTNGDSCTDSNETSKELESGSKRDEASKSQQLDSR